MSLTIGSLFSGIGGLELGLEWAGLGPVEWQVEIDPFCRAVLEKHWPQVQRFEDVAAVNAGTLSRVDVICGGFPCQDVSSAGKRAGLAGSRSGLWKEYARLVGELRPRFCVVENVASGAKLWVDQVRYDLEQLGYESLPIPLSAAEVGASHRRERIFIVAAEVNVGRKSALSVDAEMARAPEPTPDADSKQFHLRGAAQEPERRSSSFADTHGPALRQQQGGSGGTYGLGPAEPRFPGWGESEPDVVRMVHGLPKELDDRRRAALGNAVVPQCAEVIGWIVRELAGV